MQELVNFIKEKMCEKIVMVVDIESENFNKESKITKRILIQGDSTRQQIINNIELLYGTIYKIQGDEPTIQKDEEIPFMLNDTTEMLEFVKYQEFCDCVKRKDIKWLLGIEIFCNFRTLDGWYDELRLYITFDLPKKEDLENL